MAHPLDIKKIESSTVTFPQNTYMKNGVIPRFPSSCLAIGRTGSGKSNLIVNFITRPEFYRGYFDRIYLFGATGKSDGMYRDLPLKEDQVFTDPESFERDLDMLVASQREEVERDFVNAPSICIIFEDITAYPRFQNSKSFVTMFTANRHLKAMIFACGHKYKAINRTCRLQASNIFFYKSSAEEIKQLASDWSPASINEKQFIEVVEWATEPSSDDPKPFFHIACKEPEKDRFRKNLRYFLTIEKAPVKRTPTVKRPLPQTATKKSLRHKIK